MAEGGAGECEQHDRDRCRGEAEEQSPHDNPAISFATRDEASSRDMRSLSCPR
jgi:hypothetical protein